jgi:hypothetical protein
VPDLEWVLAAARKNGRVTGNCVFVGGSAARGWSNPGSDIDVYVLGGTEDKVWTIDPEGGRPRIDVHELSEGKIESLFALVSWDVVRSGNDYVNTLRDADWLLLERIYHAHVLAGADVLREHRSRLRQSAHQHMLVQEHFTFADAYAEDCLGQLAIDDLDSAVLSGHTAYLRALDGLLSARSCFAWNHKWRSRAMREAKPDLVSYEVYWAMVTMADLPALGQRAWALGCVASARDIMSRVDILRFEASG